MPNPHWAYRLSLYLLPFQYLSVLRGGLVVDIFICWANGSPPNPSWQHWLGEAPVCHCSVQAVVICHLSVTPSATEEKPAAARSTVSECYFCFSFFTIIWWNFKKPMWTLVKHLKSYVGEKFSTCCDDFFHVSFWSLNVWTNCIVYDISEMIIKVINCINTSWFILWSRSCKTMFHVFLSWLFLVLHNRRTLWRGSRHQDICFTSCILSLHNLYCLSVSDAIVFVCFSSSLLLHSAVVFTLMHTYTV